LQQRFRDWGQTQHAALEVIELVCVRPDHLRTKPKAPGIARLNGGLVATQRDRGDILNADIAAKPLPVNPSSLSASMASRASSRSLKTPTTADPLVVVDMVMRLLRVDVCGCD
jgi:hypothetical protein